jgi:hypothetical protein
MKKKKQSTVFNDKFVLKNTGEVSVFHDKDFERRYIIQDKKRSSLRILTEDEMNKYEESGNNVMDFHGLFPSEFLNRLRPFVLDGLPLNVVVASKEWCEKKGYDRALLSTLAFDDCSLVYTKQTVTSAYYPYMRYPYDKSGHYNPNDDGWGHAFVEHGKLVYDMAWGIAVNKSYYYEMEQPSSPRRFSWEECLKNNPGLFEKVTKRIDVEDAKSQFPLAKPKFIKTLTENAKSEFLSAKPEFIKTLPGIKKILQEAGSVQGSISGISRRYNPYILRELKLYEKSLNDNINDISKDLKLYEKIPNNNLNNKEFFANSDQINEK